MNIYTVVNEAYFALGLLYLRSLLEISGHNIKKIFIADVGLTDTSKKYLLSLSDKINLIPTKTYAIPKRVHDIDWKNAVSEKTRNLLLLCKEENYPLVMMDADQFVIKDISDELLDDCDFQSCAVPPEDVSDNEDEFYLGHIGSWFVIHNDNGKEFLKKWIEKMWEIEGRHVETPALQLVIEEIADSYKMKENSERVVSAPKYYKEAKVLHFRSDGQQPVDLLRRIGNLEGMPMKILEKILVCLRKSGKETKLR
jgi:hypothetical protein